MKEFVKMKIVSLMLIVVLLAMSILKLTSQRVVDIQTKPITGFISLPLANMKLSVDLIIILSCMTVLVILLFRGILTDRKR